MSNRPPTEPGSAHTHPSPSRSFQDVNDEVPKTAADLLHEDDDRLATELPILPPAHSHSDVGVQRRTSDPRWTLRPQLVRARTREQIEEDEAHRRAGFRFNRYEFVHAPRKWYDPVVAWWSRHVSVKVDVEKRRDHLALERTFLGYLRTSLALAMAGVLIAQLFRLQHSPSASTKFGFLVAGEPLAACFIVASIVVVLIGAARFWRQQSAMVRGKVWAGGWEIHAIMALSLLLCIALLAICVGVSIQHEVDDR